MCASVTAQDVEQQLSDSKNATQQLASQLKQKLVSSLQEGGPVEAIGVCNTEAIIIASALSEKYKGKVGRTSLKIRNHDNQPDDWEKSVLLNFENKKQAGEDVSQLEIYQIIEDESGKWFRYMKAIPTGDVCLMCHGEHIAPDVHEKIKSLYPNDLATGYEKGELRGAFTIKLPM